jgi:predicted nucleotide-binding protein
MAQMQQELQRLQLENAELKLVNKDKGEKHEVDIYNAETQRIRALSDHEVDATTLNMNAIGKILDASKAVDELDIKSDMAKNKSAQAGRSSAPTRSGTPQL